MRCFIVTGEPSGDMLGAMIASAMKDVDISAWGGYHLRAAGVHIAHDIDDMAVMGYAKVIGRLGRFIKLLSKAKSQIKAFNPDTILLVDYGGFNLRLAKWAHKEEYRVVYLSPPKIWASRSGRIDQLKKYCNKVIVLYPFEKAYFGQRGLTVEYHGHPLADPSNVPYKPPLSPEQKGALKLVLIPGSRLQEVTLILPPMLSAAERLEDYDLIISCAESINQSTIESLIPASLKLKTTIVKGELSSLLQFADVALVASGTATIEVALAGVPQVVCYKTSEAMYQIAKRMIKVDYISLVNLMLDKPVVTELIQGHCIGPNISKEVQSLENSARRTLLLEDYSEIKMQLSRQKSIESIAEAIIGKRT